MILQSSTTGAHVLFELNCSDVLYITTTKWFWNCSLEVRMLQGITINHFWTLKFPLRKRHEMRVIMEYNILFCIWDYRRFNHTHIAAEAHCRNQTNKVFNEFIFYHESPISVHFRFNLKNIQFQFKFPMIRGHAKWHWKITEKKRG